MAAKKKTRTTKKTVKKDVVLSVKWRSPEAAIRDFDAEVKAAREHSANLLRDSEVMKRRRRAEDVLSRWTFGIDASSTVKQRPHIDAFRDELGLLMADVEMDAGMAVKVERVMGLLVKAVVRDLGRADGSVDQPPQVSTTLDSVMTPVSEPILGAGTT